VSSMTASMRFAWTFAAASAAHMIAGLNPAAAFEPYAPPIWTTVYAGIHGGANWLDASIEPFNAASATTGTIGGHIGLQSEFGGAVLGVEADIDFRSFEDTARAELDVLGHHISAAGGTEISGHGSLRVRAGIPMAQSLLVYATAGYAWASIDASINGTVDSTPFSVASGATLNGIVYGAGVEGFVSPKILLRLEYLHADYQHQVLTIPGATFAPLKIESSSDTIRAGLSWRFN
jgi:outer membrane immunogenic protein